MPAGPPAASARPINSRARSSTIIGTGPIPPSSSHPGPPLIDPSASSLRVVTESSISSAANALHALNNTHNVSPTRRNRTAPRGASSGHSRGVSWPSPPRPDLSTIPSLPVVPTRATLDPPVDLSYEADRAKLLLYTYRPTLSQTTAPPPSPLPSSQSIPSAAPPSLVLLNHVSLPWDASPGDYVEIRRIRRSEMPMRLEKGGAGGKVGGEAMRGVAKGMGRDSYVFRVGDDVPNIPVGQIQVPESVAQAFALSHRMEVEVVKLADPSEAYVDYVELRFSQYLGRADMWRLGMSLENSTVHVGERITLAGGAVRAEIQGIWRGSFRYSSGIITAKTKTIYRSKSAQVYVFIQLSQETWEFDEDGERHYEKILHGFLPELFARWSRKNASHLVTLIFFARLYYDPIEVSYFEQHDLTLGLIKDSAGRWCKDFFRVAIDFERRADWTQALGEIKRAFETCERDLLQGFHLGILKERGEAGQARLFGKWSFAYEGNVLEAINLALNPFDEHYIDRDLSRTGLCMMVITPGTGHFAVDKNLLRLTTERMIDHGIGLDLVCLSKMPLHSVPLFSYVSRRPKRLVNEDATSGAKTKPGTPDLLYFDAHMSSATDCELADCYSIPKWVNASFYSKAHDKPFRSDRFVPRCKMYEIQMLGILDHNLTTVSVPLLDLDDAPETHPVPEDRKLARDDFDAIIFGGRKESELRADTSVRGGGKGGMSSTAVSSTDNLHSLSVPASYSSARLLAKKAAEDEEQARSEGAEERRKRELSESPRSITTAVRDRSDTLTSMTSTAMYKTPPAGSHRTLAPFEPLDLQRTQLRMRSASPAPSSLSLGRASSPSRVSILTNGNSNGNGGTVSATTDSGSSTPKLTPASRLKNQPSKSSFASRFASNWLFGGIVGARSQPSFPSAATTSVGRTDVSLATGGGGSGRSPVVSPRIKGTDPQPLAVPGAPIVTPSTPPMPPPAAGKRPDDGSGVADESSSRATAAIPIASAANRTKVQRKTFDRVASGSSEDLSRSHKALHTPSLHRGSRSPHDGESSVSYTTKAAAAAFGTRASKSHVTVNPCNPRENVDASLGEGRRWQHIRPKPFKEGHSQHLVKWNSLTAPACLPLTTDFMPTPAEIQEFYEVNSYDIACYSDQVSFLVRADAAGTNLPLAVMREMASQRLSQNFQFIVLPHDNFEIDTIPATSTISASTDIAAPGPGAVPHAPTRRILLPGDSVKAGLRVGGASEVLRDASGAIYLLWSNHIHRLAFDSEKQSVTVQRFVRKVRHATESVRYKCLVWPCQMDGYKEASAVFKYPNVEAKLNFNYLDRLIAGEEDQLTSSLRYWRTRYILIPSGRDPPASSSVMPKGETFEPSEIRLTGAAKVLETIGRFQWTPPPSYGSSAAKSGHRPLRLLPTTFDPSACVLDEGLMTELERLRADEESGEKGKQIEGLTLQTVAEMMNQPNNGLVIRDRWWGFSIHEDSFTGEQFCEWLQKAFTDVKTTEDAAEWGKSLFDKGLIEHVLGSHGFLPYGHFFYRLRPPYDSSSGLAKNRMSSAKKPVKSWFGGKSPSSPRDLLQKHAIMSTSPQTTANAHAPLSKLSNGEAREKKRKIRMTQSVIIDLDPGKKSDRAEVAVLHADIIHNAKNAFHFELNWLGVTAALLDELRNKCAAQADRYGLRFVEAPVEQIKDVSLKCAYRTSIPIPLALAPPNIPDLHLRLAALDDNDTTMSGGTAANWFEYQILHEFGFVLDVEATSRYPDNVEVEYSYRGQAKFEYSQFCHKSGVALVQCVGGERGFLWADNRLFISAPGRARGGGGGLAGGGEVGRKLEKAEEARQLRLDFAAFCKDKEGLRRWYEEKTPRPVGMGGVVSPPPPPPEDGKADGDADGELKSQTIEGGKEG